MKTLTSVNDGSLSSIPFNEHQLFEIKEGFASELSYEQIAVYARPEFNCKQMEQIRLGFENALPIECVLIYANPFYEFGRMEVIRNSPRLY